MQTFTKEQLDIELLKQKNEDFNQSLVRIENMQLWIRDKLDSNQKWMLGLMGTGFATLLGLMAHGFHWIK